MPVESADEGAVTADSPVPFETNDYGTAQNPKTVTVYGEEDADEDDEQTSVTLTATGGGCDSTVTVVVNVEDNDKSIVVSTNSLSVIEGETRTFTVWLSSAPPVDVDVALENDEPNLAGVTSTVTVPTSNAPQPVVVSGLQYDALAEQPEITLTAPGYQSATVTVTVEEDKTPVLDSIANRRWIVGHPASMTLPAGTGGNEPLTYSLSGALPAGMARSGRVISGVPTAPQAPRTYTWTATDKDGDTASQSFTITVEPDRSPAFGDIVDQVWTENHPVDVSLEVTGGNASVTCSVSPPLPAGVTMGSSAPCILSGTPTAVQPSTPYTFTATDYDGDTATLVVSIEVEADTTPTFGAVESPLVWTEGRTSVDLSLGVTGGNADVTCSVTPESPALPAGVTLDPTPPCGLSGLPTTAQPATDYTFAATDRDGDEASLVVSIEVEADSAPEFEVTVIDPLILSLNKPMAPVTLPSAVGGNAPLTCSVTPDLPAGLTLAGSPPCVLSGTPTVEQPETAYAYRVTDRDGDEVELPLTIEVDSKPTFGTATIADVDLIRTIAMLAVELPAATGGDGELTYEILEALPSGLLFDGSTRVLSGTPLEVWEDAADAPERTQFTYRVTDADETDPDSASLTFRIRVVENVAPTFGAVEAQVWTQGRTAVDLVLPLTGGNGEARCGPPAPAVLPAGVTFDESTCRLFGTPTAVRPGTVYTFRGTDSDGDDSEADSATLALMLTVEADSAPVFSAMADQTFAVGAAVELSLGVVGGNAPLACAAPESPELPAGVTLDASTCTLVGTPTAIQASAAYRFTVEDRDGDGDAVSFGIEVEAASDNASFVSYANVPGSMAAGSSAEVTVTMENVGSTTWTPSSYALGSQSPKDNVRWGRNRVALPGEVAPGASVALTFEITAPSELKSHKFRWRMVREAPGGESKRFGAKTDLLEIVVEEDVSPSFGDASILGLRLVKGVAMDPVTLPAATGGNGELRYRVIETLPSGLSFDEATRVLSGTPTKKQEPTQYTYLVEDADGDVATLVFTIEIVGKAKDDASFVSYGAVPERMAAGSTATVTVRMLNVGSTTWTAGTYKLGSQGPENNVTWGRKRVPLAADVRPNEEALFEFEITAPPGVRSHKFRWKMVRKDQGSAAEWFGSKTELRRIEVESGSSPSFGGASILGLRLVKNAAMDPVTLPAATGGNGDLSYDILETLPSGLAFDDSTRILSGTPTAKQDVSQYTYEVEDADGDTASLPLTIEIVGKAKDDASFVSYGAVPERMAADSTATVTVRMLNTGTTTWTSDRYKLGSQAPKNNTTWGMKRVPLSSAVPPNGEALFEFEITAPSSADGYKFRWRMLRKEQGSAAERFGGKTELRTIEVEALSFGDATIADQKWTVGEPIEPVVLPEASGTSGVLSYALTPVLPAGVSLDGSTQTLSGTPTEVQAETEYTYTATDENGNSASLTFNIEVVAAPVDDASFVSWSGVPSKMAVGSTATVTVTMENVGTTTWTKSLHYRLGSESPRDNETWGVNRAYLPGSDDAPVEVLPNGTVEFTFEITAPSTVGSYAFEWRMVRNGVSWFGSSTGSVMIEVEDPSFGDEVIVDQTYVKDIPIEPVVLPAASGSGGALSYAVTPPLPAGLTFTESTRTLSGTPTVVQAATAYTYTATDGAGNSASLTFHITVEAVSRDGASFVSTSGAPSKMAAGSTAVVTVTMENTGTTTWTEAGLYRLGSQDPQDNETWGTNRVHLPADPESLGNSVSVPPNTTVDFTFEMTAPSTLGPHAFEWQMVRNGVAWFGESTGSVTIEVEDPSFGDQTIADATYLTNEPIEPVVLPAASGTGGALSYAVTHPLPAGLSFSESTRTISGTPTEATATTEYTYTATDGNGSTASLTFSMTVVEALVDDASFESWSGVPSQVTPGSTWSVTVTMKNTGTTTWTEAEEYRLGSQDPQDNVTWGLNRVELPGGADVSASVGPGETVGFTWTITAPSTVGSHAFEWKMVRNGVAWFGESTWSVTIEVEDPSFGGQAIAAQTWVRDETVASVVLPAATGTGGALSYAVTPGLPAGVSFSASTRTLSGTPTAVQAETAYTYTATDGNGNSATLMFTIEVSEGAVGSAAASSRAGGVDPGLVEPSESSAPSGDMFDMFEYWLSPHGSASGVRSRLVDGRLWPAADSHELRSFWRGELWGRPMALLGTPGGDRYDLFEETEGGLDYWGTVEGGSSDRLSVSLDRPFRWMNRYMAVGDALESSVTGRYLSNRLRNEAGALATTMRLEVVAHHASFTAPVVGGLTFEDVLEVRFWADARLPEAYDEFYLARGRGAVYSRRSASGPGEVAEWWAVAESLVPVPSYRPSSPWFDPFSPGWPKTAVVNGGLDDVASELEGGEVRMSAAPGWTSDSGDAVVARSPAGPADAGTSGSWGLLLRGAVSGGDAVSDSAVAAEWIPVEGGVYELSACVLREHAGDNVFVDFDDGRGRDASFEDAHVVASSVGAWECRAVTKCIPASVGGVRIRAAREGDNQGDAWFDEIQLTRIAACSEPPARGRLER